MSYQNPYSQMPAPTQPALAATIGRSPQMSVMRFAFAIIGILIALLLGLLVLLLIGIETGPIALMVGLVTATIPVPLYVIVVLWIDRYESEPPWMLAVAFFWGALVAVFVAFLLNTLVGLIVGALTHNLKAGETFAAVISAPIVEECAKAIILFIFFFARKDEFDGVIDGIVYGSLVALGFAMTENIQYYGKAALEGGGGGLTLTLLIRGAFAPFSHPLFTSMTGIGLGLARQSNNIAVKTLTPILGLLMAIFMHSIWNGSAAIFGGGVFVLTYILVMVPAFFILLVVISLALRREGQVVTEFLRVECERGFLTKQEYDELCSIRGRMGASYNALSRGGVQQWRNRRRFNQLASELAFHRSRVARGVSTATKTLSELENVYLQELQNLAQQARSR
jgi:RsiW-degrading membrane proteinase PrsW (M82 family)